MEVRNISSALSKAELYFCTASRAGMYVPIKQKTRNELNWIKTDKDCGN